MSSCTATQAQNLDDPRNHIPDSDGWTISKCLIEAKRLQKEWPEKGVDRSGKEQVAERMSWEEVKGFVGRCDLEPLTRHPSAEALYYNHFNPLVRKHYGSVHSLLYQALGWQDLENETNVTEVKAESGEEKEDVKVFSSDETVSVEGRDWKVRENDWPYSVPAGVSHFILWTRHRLLHPSLSPNPQEWEKVKRIGAAGFTGLDPRDHLCWDKKVVGADTKPPSDSNSNEQLKCGFAGGENGTARELEKWTKKIWKEEDGWQTAWLVNPPHLQSVQSIQHFHILVRRKPTANGQ